MKNCAAVWFTCGRDVEALGWSVASVRRVIPGVKVFIVEDEKDPLPCAVKDRVGLCCWIRGIDHGRHIDGLPVLAHIAEKFVYVVRNFPELEWILKVDSDTLAVGSLPGSPWLGCTVVGEAGGSLGGVQSVQGAAYLVAARAVKAAFPAGCSPSSVISRWVASYGNVHAQFWCEDQILTPLLAGACGQVVHARRRFLRFHDYRKYDYTQPDGVWPRVTSGFVEYGRLRQLRGDWSERFAMRDRVMAAAFKEFA